MMWEVVLQDDGSVVATCGRCDWQRTVKSMRGGKRSATHHYGKQHLGSVAGREGQHALT
jgi:hypothetical protein